MEIVNSNIYNEDRNYGNKYLEENSGMNNTASFFVFFCESLSNLQPSSYSSVSFSPAILSSSPVFSLSSAVSSHIFGSLSSDSLFCSSFFSSLSSNTALSVSSDAFITSPWLYISQFPQILLSSSSLKNSLTDINASLLSKGDEIRPSLSSFLFQNLQAHGKTPEELTHAYPSLRCSSSLSSFPLSKKESLKGKLAFSYFGIGCILIFNFILDSLFSICSTQFNDGSLTDILIAIYQSSNIITQCIFLYTGALRVNTLILSFIFSAFTAILVPLSTHIPKGIYAVVVLHVIMSLVGIGRGMTTACGCALAAVTRENFSGDFAFGSGCGGVVAFFVWIIASKAIWNIETLQGLQYSCWFVYTFASIFCLFAAIICIWFFKKEWAMSAVMVANKNKTKKVAEESSHSNADDDIDDINNNSFNGTCTRLSNSSYIMDKTLNKRGTSCNFCKKQEQYPALSAHSQKESVLTLTARPWFRIAYDCRYELFNIFFTMLLTFILFPNIGPYAWIGIDLGQKNILVGMLQIADFIGRTLANIDRIRVSQKTVFICCLLRVVFFPFFILPFKIVSNFFNSFAYHVIIMIIFSVTNGWCLTTSTYYVPECVEHKEEKGKAGLYGSLALLIGSAMGMWLSKLLKL